MTDPIATVAASLVGGNCVAPDILPCIRLAWGEPTIDPGDTFVAYRIYRRLAGSGDSYVLLDSVTAQATRTYDDCRVSSITAYQYSVRLETEAAESADSTEQPAETQDFDHTWIHLWLDPTVNLRLEPDTTRLSIDADIRTAPVFGARAEVIAGYGEDQAYDALFINYPRVLADGRWAALIALVDAQRDEVSPVVVRLGRAREMFQGVLEISQFRRDGLKQYQPRVRVHQVAE